MNLQAITVIFIVIFLPIILVSNFYIQREMDTITIQNSYDTKLIDATTDAISAFELNTANEDLSLIPDSLRSICEASTNVFTTTLATNLGISSASKNKVLPYIPAIVFTLYDGYYIYSPTQQPKIIVDKDGVYVKVGDPWVKKEGSDYVYYPDGDGLSTTWDASHSNIEEKDYGKILYSIDENYDPYNNFKIKCTIDPDAAYFTTSYILKSFIPYAMQYKNGDNYDITINYTLDNYISIKGTIKKDTQQIYYTKSGYLINPGDIDYIKLNGTDIKSDINSKYSLDNIESIIDKWIYDENKELEIRFENDVIISSKDESATTRNFQNTEDVEDNVSALKYYIRSYMFSCWVRDNLSALSESDIQLSATSLQDDFDIKQSGLDLQKDAKVFWAYGTDTVFSTNSAWNVNDTDSNFIEHKRKVIKNSIQYNLNLAMAVYNAGEGNEYYQMPILSEPEWDKLLSNVSMLAFMQGFPCGLKTYNNYALITSTKNEIMTNKDDIYYIPITDESTDGILTDTQIRNNSSIDLDTVHRIDCTDSSWINEVQTAIYFEAFSAKDIKYDKVYDYNNGSFKYDHVANECYYCIVNPNYNTILKDAINKVKNNQAIDGNMQTSLNALGIASPDDFVKTLLKAQLIADAKIKNNTFKSISATTNYGIDTFNCVEDNTPSAGNTIFSSSYHGYVTYPPAISDQTFHAEKVNTTSGIKNFDALLKDYHIENCYEIDITVRLDNPNAKDYSSPYIYFKLGSEDAITKITNTKLNEGNYLIKFTDPTKWGAYDLQLINPATNYEEDSWWDSNNVKHINGYKCKITSGKILLKSITFKYK